MFDVLIPKIVQICWQKLIFEPSSSFFTYHTISVGDDVYIGPGARFIASNSRIIIGNKVMFGPDVTIMGDHNTKVVGKYMRDVGCKQSANDKDVIIEDEVWIGTRAIILKGVKVGRGAIVGAGAVGTKNVPEYSVVIGNPAYVKKWRFTIEQILTHEKSLYPEEHRLTKEYLLQTRNIYD